MLVKNLSLRCYKKNDGRLFISVIDYGPIFGGAVDDELYQAIVEYLYPNKRKSKKGGVKK